MVHLCTATTSSATANSKNGSVSDWGLAWGLHDACSHPSGPHGAEDKASAYLMEAEVKTSPHTKLLWWEHWFRRRRLGCWSPSKGCCDHCLGSSGVAHSEEFKRYRGTKRESKSSGQMVFILQHLKVKLCFFPWYCIYSGP